LQSPPDLAKKKALVNSKIQEEEEFSSTKSATKKFFDAGSFQRALPARTVGKKTWKNGGR